MNLSAQERKWPASNQALKLGQNRVFRSSITQGEGGIEWYTEQDRAGLHEKGWARHTPQIRTVSRYEGVQQDSGHPPGQRSSEHGSEEKNYIFFTNPHRNLTNPQLWMSATNQQCHQNLWSFHQGKQNPLTSCFIIHCIKMFLYSSQFEIAVVIYLLLDLSIQMHYERSILLFITKFLYF